MRLKPILSLPVKWAVTVSPLWIRWDGDIVSLDEEDKKLITQVLEDGTAELTNGAEIRCAFGL